MQLIRRLSSDLLWIQKVYRVKEIRFELDGVDPEVLRQAATAKGLNVEQYLKSIAEQITTPPTWPKFSNCKSIISKNEECKYCSLKRKRRRRNTFPTPRSIFLVF